MYQVEFFGAKISKITKIDPITSEIIKQEENIFIFPAKHFITEDVKKKKALVEIKKELNAQLKKFEKEGKLLEAERIKRRTNYDLAMIKEVGYCNGIENYSRHLSGKKEGEPPETLLSYFPKDGFLTIVDESHVTLPQLQGMYAGDASRKNTLVEYGFRLPSARDNRPLKYEEWVERVGPVIYTSATPGKIEKEESSQIVEQIIRPTGLVDPETVVKTVSVGAPLLVEGGSGGGDIKEPPRPSGTPPSKGGDVYPGQISDFISETEKTIAKGFRVLATTLTKKMAEDLSTYLKDKKIKAEYLHSDVKTIERIKILTDFRKGKFDVLVGVNLLREGLDLPEVALIGILDADKAGFLRSETSLIQTIGRAARNAEGKVILYADIITPSIDYAIRETNRRREIQITYNKKHGITPKTIMKKIKDITEELDSAHDKAVNAELGVDLEIFKRTYAKELRKEKNTRKMKIPNTSVGQSALSDEEIGDLIYEKIIKMKEKEMNKAVKELDFETAAILRDEILALKEKFKKKEM
jgi:excinuclease ABC subunit B